MLELAPPVLPRGEPMSHLSAEAVAVIDALAPLARGEFQPRLAAVIPTGEDRVCVFTDHPTAVRRDIPTTELAEVVLRATDATFVTGRLADLFARFVRAAAPTAEQDRWIAAVGSGRLVDPELAGCREVAAGTGSLEERAVQVGAGARPTAGPRRGGGSRGQRFARRSGPPGGAGRELAVRLNADLPADVPVWWALPQSEYKDVRAQYIAMPGSLPANLVITSATGEGVTS